MVESQSHQREIPLSLEARNVVYGAKGWAWEHNHSYLAGIHLFCALLEDNSVIQAMTNLGVDVPKLRAMASAMLQDSKHRQFSHEPEQVLEEVNRAYNLAYQEAGRVKQSEVSQLHLLIGLFKQEHGAAWWLMEIAGLSLTNLRQQEKWFRTGKNRFEGQTAAILRKITSSFANPLVPQDQKQTLYAGLVRLTKGDK